MKHAVLLIIFVLALGPQSAFAAEGHGTSATEFYIDNIHFTVRFDPPHFIKGVMPRIELTAADRITGAPIIDAGLLARIEHAGKAAGHEGHDAGKAQAPTASEETGLDFGSPEQSLSGPDLSAFLRLEPQQKAGTYAATFHVHAQGRYLLTLAVTTLDGKTFSPPMTHGTEITYMPESRAPLYRMLFVMGIILLSAAAAAWVVSKRRFAREGQPMNLLDIPVIKRFLRSAWFQPLFQIPVLVVFLIIIAAGLFDIQQGDRNIATILMWTIWWAGIIFTFVLVGRVWCMMCPVGAAQDWAGGAFSLNRDFPRPLRNIWLSSFIFFGLTWWNSYSGLVNRPALTAYLFLGFFTVATGMALVFKGRAFCRYACPIGGLIGIYSMFSPLELRNKCMEVCRDHKVKECIKGTEKSRGCPMFVTPMTLDRNNYCNFCSECIKSCSQDNIAIRFRSFAKDLWVSGKGHLDEAYLAVVLVGVTIVVTGEMVEPWHRWMDFIGKFIPFEVLGLSSHAAREKGTFLAVLSVGSLIVPAALLVLASAAVGKATGPDSPLGLKDTMVRFAYMFIPVGISMHLAHNISHLFKEGPGIVPAFHRFFGVLGFKIGETDWNIMPLAGNETIFWLQMAIIMTMNVFSLYAGYRIAVRHYGDKALRAFLPMAALAAAFMIVNVFILGQPMSLRHTH